VRIFKNHAFVRFAWKEGLADSSLCEAIRDADRGLLAADLGGGVIKQRIARPGQGKSGGFRTLIAFRAGERAFFVYGFAKNARENIGGNDLTALKKLARELLAYDEEAIARAVRSGAFLELRCDEKAIS